MNALSEKLEVVSNPESTWKPAPVHLSERIKGMIIGSGFGAFRKTEQLVYMLRLGAWIKENGLDKRPRFRRREELWDFLNDREIQGQPIDYLEFGVASGISMRHWLKKNPNRESRFFGFDTFEGLPETWVHLVGETPKHAFSMGGKPPEIDDARLTWHKGLFQETMVPFLAGYRPRNRIVIHLDCDIYSGTLYVLAQMNHLLAPGTVIIFDDFSSAAHQFRAFMDYTSSYYREYRLLGSAEYGYNRVAVVFK